MLIAERFKRGTGPRLGERLIEAGLVDEEGVTRALMRQRTSGERIGEALVAMGLVEVSRIGPFLEECTGFPFFDLADGEIDLRTAQLVPETFAVARRALPVAEDGQTVVVAMADPLDISAIDELKARLGRPVRPALALSADLNDAIKRVHDVRQKAHSLLEEIGGVSSGEESFAENVAESASDAPIVRLVNNVLTGAFTLGASDIHMEPRPTEVVVRYRIDGLLYDQMSIPSSHLAAAVSRLKIMSGLDIAENRRPQDGRFSARDEQGREFDVRLSVIPTVHGQKACLRLLEKSGAVPELSALGFLSGQKETFQRMLRRPHGLLLVTGPTGSGKSTTLFASLHCIGDSTRNINTIEDPVEYAIPNANQVQVNPKIGLTFASGLRALLRQDPDVILIGEIRDRETAEIAIQAAMTGHFVLSTLHTNDAPSAVVRLQNMGIEPYLITSAVIGVVGQRLMRKICPHCQEEYVPSREVARLIELVPEGAPLPTLARGKGCRRCGGRGMRGRSATYEVMEMTDAMREIVLSGGSAHEMERQALSEGMQTMQQSARQKVLDHTTTPEEYLRVFAPGY